MKNHILLRILSFSLVAGIALDARSAKPAAYLPQDTIAKTLGTLEVTASRLPGTVESSVPTQSISSADISSRGITDISDAMRRMSGVNLRDYGGAGGMKTVSLRGLGAQHTGVIYDGIAVNDVQTGQIDLSRFSLNNIGSLTVNAGETDDIFLPARASATASSIVISTFSDADFEANALHLTARAKAGGFGYYNPFFQISKTFRHKLALSLTGDFTHADNDYPYDIKNGSASHRAHRKNSMLNSGYGELNASWKPAIGQTVNFKAYYYQSGQRLPGPVTLYNPDSNEKLKQRNSFAQLGWRGKISSKVSMRADAKFNWAASRYQDINGIYPGGRLDSRYNQQEWYISSSALYRPVSGLQLDYSIDYFYNNLSSNRTSDIRPYRNSILQSVAAKYKVWRLSATAKLLYSIYLNRSHEGDKQAKDAKRLSPSLSLSIQPVDGQKFYVRASYKNIFRMPTFNELYFDHYGSINLNPEVADQYNFGLTWSVSAGDWLEDLTITADGYLNYVKNKIVAMPYNMFVMTMTNLGKVRILGLDVTLNAAFRITPCQKILLSGSYSYQRAAPRTDPDMLDWMKQVAYTPLNSGAASLTWQNPWVTLVAHTSGYSARYATNNNMPGTRIAGYMELGFTAMHEFKFAKSRSIEIRADLINALDKQYELVNLYPMPGRNWQASVTYRF